MSDITRFINNAGFSSAQVRALTAAFASIQAEQVAQAGTESKVKADLTAIADSFNQLLSDYNGNTTIGTDSTAEPITLTSTI